MRLLNSDNIVESVNNNNQYLTIENFDTHFLHSTYYYFRLGHHFKAKLTPEAEWTSGTLNEKTPSLILPPSAYVVARSVERFRLSAEVAAIFSQTSDFIFLGLELIHSAFVDPLFEGHLEVGIWNRFATSAEIRLGMPIGKIKFFDVSDTSPIAGSEGTISELKFERRRSFQDKDPLQPWEDSYEPYKYDWRKKN